MLKVKNKIIFVLAIMLLNTILVACDRTIGNIEGNIQVYPYETAIETADLIAKVKIGKIIKETSDPSEKTFFSAQILETFKGFAEKEEIDLIQEGNSSWTFNEHHRFEKGEEYILFLQRSKSKQNTYWIQSDDVQTYLIQDNYVIKKSLKEKILETIELDRYIQESVKEKLSNKKQRFEKVGNISVFDYTQFVEELNKLIAAVEMSNLEEGGENE